MTQPPVTAGLPHRLSSFVGREAERAEVAARLDETRLLTLTGVGGCGKTSLALQVARDVGTHFPGGVFWVELAPLSDVELVAPALARSVGVRPLPGEAELEATVAVLAERRALVVLDNCEHLIERCAEVVHGLLRWCGEMTILATSRAPLRVAGETEWGVPSLSLPRRVDRNEVESALESDAVRLFLDRARRIQTGFSFDARTVGPVVEICQRLDGIPLAIELAAGRVRQLSVEQVARGLDDALSVVVGDVRMTPPRQRTLRASLDWSHDLLRPAEQVLLRRLGVFMDGFTVALAEAVCVDDALPAEALLDVLAGLVEHSLVQVVESVGTPRYRLLDMVRQYARARLGEVDELAATCDRHGDAMLELAQRQRGAFGGPDLAQALAKIDAEAANFLAAIDHAVATDPEKAQRLCIALSSWFRHRGRLREGVRACEAALAAGSGSATLRAETLVAQAFLLGIEGDFDRCIALATEAHRIAGEVGAEETEVRALLTGANFRMFSEPPTAAEELERCLELGLHRQDDWVVTRSVVLLATVAWFQQDLERCDAWVESHWDRMETVGDRQTLALARLAQGGARYATLDHARAATLLEEAMVAAREVGDPLAEGTPRMVLYLIRIASGDPRTALEDVRGLRRRLSTHGQFYFLAWAALTEAIALAASGDLTTASTTLRPIITGELGGPQVGRTWAQLELSEVLRLSGENEDARRLAASALADTGRLGNAWYEARARLSLGRLAAQAREWRQAEDLHQAALAAIVQRGLRLEIASVFEALAEVAAGMGAVDEAARLLGAAARRREAHGPVLWPAQDGELRALLDRTRDATGRARFEREFAAGAGLTDEEVVSWVQRGRGPRRRPVAGWDSLTPAELEVVRYAAAGLSNPEIGKKLFMARATVKAHLAHVYAKLELNNRTELAALAAERLRQ